MNTLVDDNIKKLLYEKGWRYDLSNEGERMKHSLGEARFNDGNFCYVDISIAEVVMWIYEKHGIWIEVCSGGFGFYWVATDKNKNVLSESKHGSYINSPTRAYLEVIVYTLNSLI